MLFIKENILINEDITFYFYKWLVLKINFIMVKQALINVMV